MAELKFTITGKLEWRNEDGDGTKCHHCGDTAWLTQYRAVFVSNIGELNLEIVMCNGCGECLRANDA